MQRTQEILSPIFRLIFQRMPELCFTGGVVSVRWLQFEAVVVARWFTAAISAARKKSRGGEKEEACGIIFFFVLLPVSLAAWSWQRTGEQDVGRFGVMHDLGLLALTLIESSLITVQAFAVCSMTQGAILVAFAAGSGELP